MDLTGLISGQIDYVARTLARLGVQSPDVEDLTQEVLIVAIRRADTFDRERRIEPWLYGIARNVASDFRRLARHRVEHSIGDEVDEHPGADGSPADATDLRKRALRLRAAVAELTAPLQELLVLHDLDELPLAEVAASLGISVNTAYARLRRARREVGARLARTGGPDGFA